MTRTIPTADISLVDDGFAFVSEVLSEGLLFKIF